MATATTAKAFISQVQAAERQATRPTPTIHGVGCGRLWIQVILCAQLFALCGGSLAY